MAGNGRVYPESVEAEQFVLGCVFHDESCLKTIMDAGMQSESFYKNAHAIVLNAFLSLSEAKNPIDLLTTGDELERMQKLSYIGGPAYLSELSDAIGSVRSLPHYIKIIKEKHSLRQIIDLSVKVQEDCFAPTAELSLIWESFVGSMVSINGDTKTGESRKDRNLTKDIRNWVLDTSGTFVGRECDIDLKIETKRDKATRRKVFQRLFNENSIERVGSRAGHYRRIETDWNEVDWKNASTDPFDIKWPFGIEKMARMFPGSIGIVAGETNMGKTAYLLNLIKLNQNQGKEIIYFSSETTGGDFKGRIQSFNDEAGMTLDDWNFRFGERSNNFSDVIVPDAINVIDYLKVLTDFWSVGQMISDIHEKLGSGVAIIAMQKDPKHNQARGGTFSMDIPIIYLNIKNNYPNGQFIEIVKAKSVVDPNNNPNGWQMGFSIYKGCILTPKGDWYQSVR